VIGDILQPTHLLFVLVVALLVLGPKRLPEVAKSLGNSLRDFRSAINGESHERDTIAKSDATTEPATIAKSDATTEAATIAKSDATTEAAAIAEPQTQPITDRRDTSAPTDAAGSRTVEDDPPLAEQVSTTDSEPIQDATVEPESPPEPQSSTEPKPSDEPEPHDYPEPHTAPEPHTEPSPDSEPKLDPELATEHRT
jgi:sec-independent protein translocase protein TatA